MTHQQFDVQARMFALAWFCGASASAQIDLDGLLRQLADGSHIGQTVYSLEGQPQDPQIAPALKTAFKNAQLKYDKQWQGTEGRRTPVAGHLSNRRVHAREV